MSANPTRQAAPGRPRGGVSAAQWDTMRAWWEYNPQVRIRDVARRLGVHHEIVRRAMRVQGWRREPVTPQTVAAAHRMADAMTPPGGSDSAESSDRRDAAPGGGAWLPSAGPSITDLQARVVNRHRGEWIRHAQLFPLDELHTNRALCVRAKMAAEVLLLRQRGERAAWGLDVVETRQEEIVIEWRDRADHCLATHTIHTTTTMPATPEAGHAV